MASGSASIANARPGSSIELHLDRVDGQLIGTMPVNQTGAPGHWREQTVATSGAIGVRDLYLVFKGGEGAMFDLDYWRFGR
jgi:hypothetical protein